MGGQLVCILIHGLPVRIKSYMV